MKSFNALLLGLCAALPVHATSARAESIVKQLMPSAKVDLSHDVGTLPLHLGYLKDGRKVWFVLTDTNNAMEAKRLGIVYAGQLSAALNARSTRTAHVDAQGTFTFDAGTVDFSPKAALTPGMAPNYFPPQQANPGSVGDKDYSPLVRLAGTNIIYNAPIVAFDVDAGKISFCDGHVNYDLVHDRVASICPAKMEVSVRLGHGFADGNPVIYFSFDANDPLPATMESATYTPATKDLLGIGAAESLYGFANGPTEKNNPDRQGFNSALSGEGAPLNILAGLTMASNGYTPLWDVNVAVWTMDAIQRGERHRITRDEDTEKLAQMGLLTNPMGGRVGSLGLLVNCPVVGFVK
jgi:hypothetical protein